MGCLNCPTWSTTAHTNAWTTSGYLWNAVQVTRYLIPTHRLVRGRKKKRKKKKTPDWLSSLGTCRKGIIGLFELTQSAIRKYTTDIVNMRYSISFRAMYILEQDPQAVSSTEPRQTKSQGCKGYYRIPRLHFRFRNHTSLYNRVPSSEPGQTAPLGAIYTSLRSNRLSTSGGTVGMYFRARSRFVPPNPAP